MSDQNFKVIIPSKMKNQPDLYEILVARILAEKFQSDVIFVECNTIHTPDLRVVKTGQYWETKNIKSNGRYTIEDNLRRASKQANNIVISLLRSKMSQEQAVSHIRWFLRHAHTNIRRVILVTKNQKTIDFFSK